MKILIIAANALSQTSNNGKTYRSFIQSMNREDIAQFYTGTNEYPDENCCMNFYRVTDFQLIKSLLKFWKPVINSHGELIKTIENKGLGGLHSNAGVVSLKRQAKNLSYFREMLWASNIWDNTELNNWIEDFKPTHIFAVLGSGLALHKITRKLSKHYNIPFSVYFTDDYIINDNSTNFIQKLYFKRTRRGYYKTLKLADKAFVIGEKMKCAYEELFNRKFDILINGIRFDEKEKNSRIYISNGETIVISYIGGLHLNRWRTIVKLAKIVSQIREYKFDIRVFCVSIPTHEVITEFEKNNIRYCGKLTAEGVKEETRKSHIMLHVESFDKTNRMYTQYSVSTKIPEYMSSMRGIIAYGPSEIASIQIFSDNNIGCAITDLDSDSEIKERIKKYLDHYNTTDFEVQYDFAKNNFNQDNMQLKNLL